jgi:hypothetical protein
MARTGIFGRSGAGKSWYAGYLLERIAPKFDYAVHFDIEDEEQGLSKKDDAVFKSFYVDEEFADRTVIYEGREMPLVLAVILENNHVRIIPDGLTPAEQRTVFAQISGLAMELGKTEANFHLSADEAHQIIPSNEEPDDRIIRMLTGGRKKGVEWMLITQRPANLHEEAYSQMNFAAYFSLTKDVDLAKVNGSSGFNAYTWLPELDPREYILEDLDSGELKEKDTNNLERDYPHTAGDDGKADNVIEESVEGGDDLREKIEAER